jgi:L-threonylcarbamoyladenylate synthase
VKSRTIRIDPGGELPSEVLEDLSGTLLAGGVIVYPTETFYGLGAAGFSRRGVRTVFRIKRRERTKPLSVLASDLDMVVRISSDLPPALKILAGEFWPGPLSVVLAAAPDLPSFLKSAAGTIAVRIPPASWLRDLVRAICQPLTATSANLSGGREISSPSEAARLFSGKADVLVDGGDTPGGRPTTLLDLTRDRPMVLREGAVSAASIGEVLGTAISRTT